MMLKRRFKQLCIGLGLSFGVVVLSGCASFTGVRSPSYDGRSIEPDQEAIETYQDHSIVNEENESLYTRYPLSESLREGSLDFSDNDSLELNEGSYTVGEDLPEGRVYLQGESSDFRPDRWIIHTANVIVRDQEDAVVFEQHFQDEAGVMQAIVDLREGHTVTLTGNDPILFVDYTESAAATDQGNAEGNAVTLISGHYEVGNHIEAGEYRIEGMVSPRSSELYIFSGESGTDIIELHSRLNPYSVISEEENQQLLDTAQITPDMYEMNETNRLLFEESITTIVLEEGDTLYLPMVDQLILEEY